MDAPIESGLLDSNKDAPLFPGVLCIINTGLLEIGRSSSSSLSELNSLNKEKDLKNLESELLDDEELEDSSFTKVTGDWG